MKVGSGDRKKMIVAGTLGAVALGSVLYTFLGGSSDAATPAPVAVTTASVSRATPGPAARVSRTATDPTLHPEAMELTEQMQYTGTGRNIFALNSAPPVRVSIPKPIIGPRIQQTIAPVYAGPPPQPAIDLKFFGTATKSDGMRQAFFLGGDDVFLAMEGEVVSRRYKVGPIGTASVQVTDLTNNNTQRLQLLPQ